MTVSNITSDNEWQPMTTSGTTSGTMSDNEWQRVTKIDNEWLFRPICFFLENSTNRHSKENPLNLEEDFEEDLLN